MTNGIIRETTATCIGCGHPLSIHNHGVKCGACEGSPTGRSRPPQVTRCRVEGCLEAACKASLGVISGRFRNLCDEHHDQEQDDAIAERAAATTSIVVPGRERTYEEMIGRGAVADKPLPKCAECGRDMPASQAGWLCSRCQAKPLAAEPEAPAPVLEEPPAPEPDEAPAAVEADTSEPVRLRFVAAGPMRRFDHAEAVRLYREHESYAEVGRLLGVTPKSARFAIIAELERTGQSAPVVSRGRKTTASGPARCRVAGCSELARAESLEKKSWNWRNLCDAHHQAQLDEQNAERAAARAIAPIVAFTCKRDGCDETPECMKGIYAKLCAEHTRQAKLERRGVRLFTPTELAPAFPGLVPVPGPPPAPTSAYSQRMLELAEVSRELGEISTRLDELRDRRAELMQRWADLTLLLQPATHRNGEPA